MSREQLLAEELMKLPAVAPSSADVTRWQEGTLEGSQSGQGARVEDGDTGRGASCERGSAQLADEETSRSVSHHSRGSHVAAARSIDEWETAAAASCVLRSHSS